MKNKKLIKNSGHSFKILILWVKGVKGQNVPKCKIKMTLPCIVSQEQCSI